MPYIDADSVVDPSSPSTTSPSQIWGKVRVSIHESKRQGAPAREGGLRALGAG